MPFVSFQSPSNTVTSELLKYFSKNKTEQAPRPSSVAKAPMAPPKMQAATTNSVVATTTAITTTAAAAAVAPSKPANPPIVPKPAAPATPVRPAIATATNNGTQKKPEPKNVNKKGKSECLRRARWFHVDFWDRTECRVKLRVRCDRDPTCSVLSIVD